MTIPRGTSRQLDETLARLNREAAWPAGAQNFCAGGENATSPR